MSESGDSRYQPLVRASAKWLVLLAIVALGLSPGGVPLHSDTPQISHDGLHLEKGSKASVVYVDPEADFTVYKRHMMLPPYVAFKKNWERDTKVAGRRVPKQHIAKVKEEAAKLLEEVFREQLEANDGFPRAAEADDDVMLLRPAIIDLVVTAPDVPMAGRVENYVASSIAATLYLELYDSVTGDILARVMDRQIIRDQGYARWATSVTNRADAKRIFKRWAVWLRDAWDGVYREKQAAGG
jgi:hypothetical protein